MKRILLTLIILLLSGTAVAGIQIQSGTTTNTADVNANSALRVTEGRSTRATYIASALAQATTAAITVSLEAPATQTVYVTRICTSGSAATTASAINVTVQRRTTASSGGTLLTNEGTGSSVISKLDPADGNYAGVGRLGGTPGTAGAVITGWGYTDSEIAAGTADPDGFFVHCREFGIHGGKPLTISPGIANGISVDVSSHGAGGLASGSVTIQYYVE